MTLAELSAVFYDLGCKTAYNLDGGQTAMMIFEGSPSIRLIMGAASE
jgi:exopolysaccharide biosynthesis protein